MTKTVITSDKAPAAIGPYSQAIKAGNTVYMSGQIPLDPKTMELVDGIEAQVVQVFENLKSVAEAAGGSFRDIVKLNIFLTDLGNFAKVNEIMGKYFEQPYPARAAIRSLRDNKLDKVKSTPEMYERGSGPSSGTLVPGPDY